MKFRYVILGHIIAMLIGVGFAMLVAKWWLPL